MKANRRNLARVEENIAEGRAQLSEEKSWSVSRLGQEKTRFGQTIPSQYRQSNQDNTVHKDI